MERKGSGKWMKSEKRCGQGPWRCRRLRAYLMKNASNEIIYIGKAKALKNRVSQYFGSPKNHPPKVRKMVSQVDHFDYILTDSEFEALVLECSLIKQHTPKYNILLKDDKGYHYIKVTPKPYRRIFEAKQKLNDGAEYIGPYTSSFSVKQSVDEARKIFKLPTCSRKFPQEIGKGRPCLNYFIKQCCAPCRGKLSEEEYEGYVDEALEFLKGGSVASVKDMTQQMNEAAENLEFERAARIRDRISAVKRITAKQKVVATKVREQDVVAMAQAAGAAAHACVVVFRFSGGRLCDQEEFMLGEIADGKNHPCGIFAAVLRAADRAPPGNSGRRGGGQGGSAAVAVGKGGAVSEAHRSPKGRAGPFGGYVQEKRLGKTGAAGRTHGS